MIGNLLLGERLRTGVLRIGPEYSWVVADTFNEIAATNVHERISANIVLVEDMLLIGSRRLQGILLAVRVFDGNEINVRTAVTALIEGKGGSIRIRVGA